MGDIPNLVDELKNTLKDCLAELQNASKELETKGSRINDISQECNDKGCNTPKDCYLQCGDEIKVTPEEKKKWKARNNAKSKRPKPKSSIKSG